MLINQLVGFELYTSPVALMPESVLIQLHLRKACWEIWLADDKHFVWLHWTMAEGTVQGDNPAKFPTKSTE